MASRGRLVLAVAAAIALLGAGAGVVLTRDADTNPSPSPTPSNTQSPGPALGATGLKYRLIDRFDPIFFCDPDFYPVGSEEGERQNARSWWNAADRSGDEVKTILVRLKFADAVGDQQILSAYREHKRLTAVGLEASGERFAFMLRSGSESSALQVAGTIARNGAIRVTDQRRTEASCPICLAAGTLIDTPDGQVDVRALRAGMLVWTVDERGRRVIGNVVRTAVRRLGAPALLLHVSLDDGRNLVASAAHPSAGGPLLGALDDGDILDGAVVSKIEIVPAGDGTTYDLLPSGPTGAYWANGILLRTTLA